MPCERTRPETGDEAFASTREIGFTIGEPRICRKRQPARRLVFPAQYPRSARRARDADGLRRDRGQGRELRVAGRRAQTNEGVVRRLPRWKARRPRGRRGSTRHVLSALAPPLPRRCLGGGCVGGSISSRVSSAGFPRAREGDRPSPTGRTDRVATRAPPCLPLADLKFPPGVCLNSSTIAGCNALFTQSNASPAS